VATVATARLRARLGGPDRDARVVHRGRHAVYLDLDGWCLGVVSAAATAVPCALRTTLPELGALADADRARVVDDQLLLDDAVLRIGRLHDLTVPSLPSPRPWLADALLAVAQPAADELGDLLDRPLSTLVGQGSGLTPLADDVLCGWLAVRHALGVPAPVPDARARTTLLSATLVECAGHGEAIPEFRMLVHTMAGGDRAAVARAAETVARVGHTSGQGLLLGAGLALQQPIAQDRSSMIHPTKLLAALALPRGPR
jgi:hypothetical protein